MKDWKTPEIKDLEISATEYKGGNDKNPNFGNCPIPVGSGGTIGDVDWKDDGHKDNGKNHGGKH